MYFEDSSATVLHSIKHELNSIKHILHPIMYCIPLNIYCIPSNMYCVLFLPIISTPHNRRYFQHAHFIPIVGVGKRGEYDWSMVTCQGSTPSELPWGSMAPCRRTLGSERHRYAIARPHNLGTDPMAYGGYKWTNGRRRGTREESLK